MSYKILLENYSELDDESSQSLLLQNSLFEQTNNYETMSADDGMSVTEVVK